MSTRHEAIPAFPEHQELPALLRDLAEEIESADLYGREAFVAGRQGRNSDANRHAGQMNRANRRVERMKADLRRRIR